MDNNLDKLIKPELLKVKSYIPGKPIEEVKRELGLKEVTKLASNENAIGPSPKAIKAIAKDLDNIYQYPESNCFYLKQRLSKYLNVDSNQLIIGNGSDEIIVLVLRVFVKPSDKVIIADPTFLIYEIQSMVNGADLVKVPLKDFRHDIKQMKKAIDSNTKLVFIANPDNPTGTYLTNDEIDEFMQGLPDDLIVFFDEAYYEFAKDKEDYPDTLKFIDKKNVIITRTFSKSYGLAGLRVGYGITSNEIVSYMDKVREPFNVNRVAQVAATAALDDEEFLNRTLKFVHDGKLYLYKQFEKMGLEFIQSSTNFVLVNLKKDCDEISNKLLKKGIIIRNMKNWGLDNFIRITVGTKKQNKKFIKALSEIL